MILEPIKITLENNIEFVLRSALESDSKSLLEHLIITHSESYRNLNQSVNYWKNFSELDEQKILKDFESSKSKFMLIAEHNGTIVGGLGFVGLQAEFVRKTGQFGMSIQKRFAGLGLGFKMVRAALNAAKESGFHRVELTVRTYNLAGIKLYEKAGFQRIGLLKDAAFIDGEFVDEYSYQILLNSLSGIEKVDTEMHQ